MLVFADPPPPVLLWSEVGMYDMDLLKQFPVFVGYGNETLRHIATAVALRQMTPFDFVQSLLGNERYDIMDTYFDTILRGA
jgi:hypothetical protein